MDTKLKKTHKLTILIISLVVLIPALILTALYPRMEDQYYKKLKEYNREELNEETSEYELIYNFTNYVTEAVYYWYADMYQERNPETEVRIDVLDENGWYVDRDEVESETSYYVEYIADDKVDFRTNSDENLKAFLDDPSEELKRNFREEGYMGYQILEFDSYGKVKDIVFEALPGSEIAYDRDIYSDVKNSIDQYANNVDYYNEMYEEDIKAKDLLPKNIRAVVLVDENSEFIWQCGDSIVYRGADYIYMENGVMYIIVLFAILVALAALILPFFKALDTGWEKLFSMPFEINVVLCCVGISMAIGMFQAMCYTRFADIEAAIVQDSTGFEVLGYVIGPKLVYGIALGLNFLGWAACFLMEYIVVAHVRQFFAAPKYYIKHRFLIVSVFRWAKQKLHKLYQWVTDIDIAYELNKSIVKVVLANFVILTFLCCLWLLGIAGLILYSVALYILFRKYGEKLQKQYRSVLKATEGMADGNLKIAMDEDLGVFQPLGKELERVQEGFVKAVREEAKSQNMKTELITNVSHDLKTPLTAIITYVDLLKQEGITEEQRASYIDTLEQKSQRLKALIEDLFEISKANSGNVKMNFMDVDVVNLMKQVRLEMEDKIMNSDLTFRWNFPEEKVILSLDGQRTYRIFENLLNNILKYAMPGSRVYVDVKSLENEVEIMFRNISASELDYEVEHLTDRFVRGDASRNTEGSGLGLAIVKSFVELQNGTFRVEVDGDLFKAIIVWKK